MWHEWQSLLSLSPSPPSLSPSPPLPRLPAVEERQMAVVTKARKLNMEKSEENSHSQNNKKNVNCRN